MVWMRHDGTWSNASADRVVIEPYDPRWPLAFEQEAAVLRQVIPVGVQLEIEHVGSTAVPGLGAKPIVDIMLVVRDRRRWPDFIAPLESIGYVHWASNPNPARMFFVKGMPPYGEKRTHHVHVRIPADARDVLRFRDHLRSHRSTAARYEKLKRSLAVVNDTEREAYTAAKGAFVREVLSEARTAEQSNGTGDS